MSCACSHRSRTTILADLVTVYGKGAAICFSQTKREADEVTAALGRRMAAEVLHEDIAQALPSARSSASATGASACSWRRTSPRTSWTSPTWTWCTTARRQSPCVLRPHGTRQQAGQRHRDVHAREQYRVKLIVRETGVKFRQINPPPARVTTASPSKPASRCGWWMMSCYRATRQERSSRRSRRTPTRSPVRWSPRRSRPSLATPSPRPALHALGRRAHHAHRRADPAAATCCAMAASARRRRRVGRIRVLAGNDGLCWYHPRAGQAPARGGSRGALDGIGIELPDPPRDGGGARARPTRPGGVRGRERGRGRGGRRGFRGGGGGRFERRSDEFERSGGGDMAAAAVAAAGRIPTGARARRPRRRRVRRRPAAVRGAAVAAAAAARGTADTRINASARADACHILLCYARTSRAPPKGAVHDASIRVGGLRSR